MTAGAMDEQTRKLGGPRGAPQDWADPDELVGQVLAERYELEQLVGRGGMGAVYRARHLLLQKNVAVKVLHRQLLATEGAVARFRREARAAAALQSEHVVSVSDYGITDGGRAYLVMEYLEGQNLRARLSDGPLPPATAALVAAQILRGLQRAHEQGIVHRDLKPENILLQREGGGVKLLDFGLARVVGDEGCSWTTDGRLTASGLIVGTPHYMAPEQVVPDGEQGPGADLYAVGVVLYEMLTGERPFESPSTLDVLVMQRDKTPVPPRRLRPELDIPHHLERVTLRALAKDPAARYASAAEMRAELLRARDTAPLAPAAPRLGRQGLLIVVGTALVAVLALLVALRQGGSPADRGTGGSGLTAGGGPAGVAARAAAPGQAASAAQAGSPGHAAVPRPGQPARGVARGQTDAAPATAQAGPLVTLQLAVDPPRARVTLDGAPLEPGAVRLTPSSRPRLLVVRAEGYRTVRRRLVLRDDRALRIKLQRQLQLQRVHPVPPHGPSGRPQQPLETPEHGLRPNPYR